VVKFPAELNRLEDLELLFRRAVSRSSMGRSTVRVPQLPRIRQIVSDISRTPAGERVRETYRQVNMWTDESVSSTFLPGTGAAALLHACAAEASALLELGYRRQDGIDFITSLPDPAVDPVRPLTQIRSAISHLGGDMGLFRDMLISPVPSSPELKLVFSVWPTGGRLPDAWRPGHKTTQLHLQVREAPVPLVISFSERMQGYALLYTWDLARGMAGERKEVKLTRPSFQAFSEEF